MKNLALASLTLALVASQATGCTSSSEDAIITARWELRDIATNTETDCPVGFETVALHNQEIDTAGRPVGSEVIDLFDCIDGIHDSAPLFPSVYDTWVEVTNDSGSLLYAESLHADVDVIDVDQTFDTTIYNDGGYFLFGWQLQDEVSQASLSCSQVSNLDGIEIFSTISGSQQAVVDQFDCENGFDYTGGLLAGTYQLSIDAFMDGNPDLAIGPSVQLDDKVIDVQNRVTDLGDVTIQISP